MMEKAKNSSQVGDQPGSFVTYGLIVLPQEYEVERDVVVNIVGVMSLFSLLTNAILLAVIIKDPFKQLRTITSILLAFNSAANLTISSVLFLDWVFFLSHSQFSPEVVVYLGTCSACLYFIGNLLHSLNIYATIVVPVRYTYFAPKVRKILVQCLSLLWIITSCVTIIPPYALPKSKIPSYVKGMITFVCVQLALLTFTLVWLYTRIFRTLYARKQRFVGTFNIKHSTPQGLKMMRRNYEVAKTLFIHVIFFVIATAPTTIMVMIFLHCTSSCDPTKVALSCLFSFPCMFTTFVFHPVLWLSRLSSYKQAMIQTLSFRQSQIKPPSINNHRDNNNSRGADEFGKPRTVTLSTDL